MSERKIIITYAKAPSLETVAYSLARFFGRNGVKVFLTRYFRPQIVWATEFIGIIFVVPADPVRANEYLSYYITLEPRFKDKMIWYATIEGKLISHFARKHGWFYVNFVANSNYTARNLEEENYKVIDVIPHGWDPEDVDKANQMKNALIQKLEKDFPNVVRFGIVSSAHPRKNIDGLLMAIASLDEKVRNNSAFFFISENSIKHLMPKNAYFVSEFGSLQHTEVLAFMSAMHFMIFPSFCEGFGLPVIESNAMRTPIIHAWYEPLSDISTKEGNITFDYDNIREIEGEGGIMYEYHVFSHEKLKSAIEYAYSIFTENKDQYEKMREIAYQNAQKFNADVVYKKFLEYFTQ